jgi:uncharacterized protein involved in type VI secretion and phage assembly
MSDLLDMFGASQQRTDRIYGVVIGIVTNNRDPEKIGRVRLKFPWLSEQVESDWARIVTPQAGKQHGFYSVPDVGDEVLVAFEQGDPRSPYVLGALWGTPTPPPLSNEDGKNPIRAIVSRSGMQIQLDDTSGAEQIVICDKDGKNTLIIDMAHGTIRLSADQDLTIVATNGKLTLQGHEVSIVSDSTLEMTASGAMKIKGATVDIN